MKNQDKFDSGIIDLIVWLNENDIKTLHSCSGHQSGFKPEGMIVFKTIKDCEKFKELLLDVRIFNSIRIGNYSYASKKALYFEYDKELNQIQIDSLWKDLLCKISFNKYLQRCKQ